METSELDFHFNMKVVALCLSFPTHGHKLQSDTRSSSYSLERNTPGAEEGTVTLVGLPKNPMVAACKIFMRAKGIPRDEDGE
ncbi:hypothetical protein A2U01_0062844, partial [Trifolium medium]|nr:hypothetical protein [Trifolium medium]